MKCPYLSEASKKVCVKMLELKLKGDLTDFDIRHYCTGNPIFCYYFRLPQIEKEMKENEKKKLRTIFKGEIPQLKLKREIEVTPEEIKLLKPKIVE